MSFDSLESKLLIIIRKITSIENHISDLLQLISKQKTDTDIDMDMDMDIEGEEILKKPKPKQSK